MPAIDMKLCILCFERVLGCSECSDCDANRYCPGHYLLRAQQRGRLHVGGMFEGIGDVQDQDEFVRVFNRAVLLGLIQTF
jgi:hypothetical protein